MKEKKLVYKENTKSNNAKILFLGVILGGIIFGGIGVAAITLQANQVKYTPSNSGFNATNAEEALDKLYTMTGNIEKGKLTLVGTTTSFNIADIVGEENVGNYTAADFIVVPDISEVLTGSADIASPGSYGIGRVQYSLQSLKDFLVSYDNTNGDVIIENQQLKITGQIYGGVYNGTLQSTTSYTYSISPKVYLYV